MKFTENNHPTRLFVPTRLIGTWEYRHFSTDESIALQLKFQSCDVISWKMRYKEVVLLCRRASVRQKEVRRSRLKTLWEK